MQILELEDDLYKTLTIVAAFEQKTVEAYIRNIHFQYIQNAHPDEYFDTLMRSMDAQIAEVQPDDGSESSSQ